MTSDDLIVEYLRARGRAAPPVDLVPSVMTAVDFAADPRSRFSAYLPALVAAGAVAVIALVALLIVPGRDLGPAPTPSGTPAPSATSATLAELEAAVTGATERLAAAPAVEGIHTYTLEGYLASATWFDWRSSGEQVVITRTDVDVSAPWWTDPEGEPLTVGERIDTDIWVIVENTAYASRDQTWLVLSRADAPPVLGWATGMLSGEIPPIGGIDPGSEPAITRRALGDGVEVWRLEIDTDDGGIVEWRIGSDGRLSSYLIEGFDVTFEPVALDNAAARAVIEFTAVDEPDPIQAPNPDAVPDAGLFGLPADFPLAPGEAAIDYRAYVEDTLDALEAYHWNSANIDWTAARSAALDGLPEEPTEDQAHARIQRAIGTFDVFNTAFIRPQDVPPGGPGGGGASADEVLSSERLGEIGLIALPAPPTDGTHALVEYLQAARTAMADVEESAPACGWIVDLRDYNGFAWGPSMFALGGLLGEGRVVTFRSPAGEWWLEVDDRGVVSSSSFDDADDPIDSPYIETYSEVQRDDALAEAVAAQPPHVASVQEAPVAVLVGNRTRSGGEQTLVAFLGRPATRVLGGPTAGMPVVAPNLPMADGAVLRIPTWVPVDRIGTAHTTTIMPDEVIGDTRSLGSDAILDAAVEWLENQDGCS